jgi:arylsulfatase
LKIEKKNVILILSDQLRADCVGCYGNDVIQTPHIDALAAGGARFENTFAQHPQCAPSRAALLTGRYPHVNGAVSNHTAMGENEVTLGEYFRAAGYKSIGVGKLHLFNEKEASSFDETMISGGQQSDATSPECLHEDYKGWLKANGYWEAAEKAYAIHETDEYWDNFQANVNPIPAEAYIDSWVGDRAVDYVNQQDGDPFFMFVGLPNPHMPFDCPEPYASMYDPDDMPVPETFGMSLDGKPPIQAAFKRKGRRVNYEEMDEAKLRQAMAYYYGAVTLVDDQVGKIVAAVEASGLAENTVIVFCSDHGELLGHYGMLTKSIDEYPILYDVGLKVPMIISDPGRRKSASIKQSVELIDLCPTLLSRAGLDIAPEIQGMDLSDAVMGGEAPRRDYVFSESGAGKMLRGERYKLVHYPGQSYGELYDIVEDPDETRNLYDDATHRQTREQLTRDLLDRLIHTEAARHGESKRGEAYWRYLYKKAFEDE